MRGFDHLVLAVDDLGRASDFYETLGFTVAPLAHHPFGTSNRLVQMGTTFLELVTVTRPELIPDAGKNDFNFPAFNRDYLSSQQGFSMLALTSGGSDADRLEFSLKNITLYNPFEFTRLARQPDGRDVTVGFKLTFVSGPELLGIPVFTCHHQHAPEFFWKPDYQQHANGARDVTSIEISSDNRTGLKSFLSELDLNEIIAGVEVIPKATGGTRYSGFTVAVDDLKKLEDILIDNNIAHHISPDGVNVSAVFGVDIHFIKIGNARP